VRRTIPALSTRTYLDSAGAGLPPLSVTRAMREFVESWSREGEHWEEWLADILKLRERFAKLIGAGDNEVGVVPSASVGLVELASSLDLSRRKKVVVSDLNFPSNVLLWQRMREAGLLKKVVVLRGHNGIVPLEAWEPLEKELSAFVEAVATGGPMPVGPDDALAAIAIADALAESGRTGMPVRPVRI